MDAMANDNRKGVAAARKRQARTFWKPVFRWSPREKKYRIGRLIWTTGDGPSTGGGYSQKLSFAFWLKPFGFDRRRFHWRITVLFFVIHYRRAYGGWMV